MVAYRFCRSDDIPALVDGYNRCWRPHRPEIRELDRKQFKGWIRELQLWTSSCMLASDDGEPIGVLLGCKREESTLIWRLAVVPEHLQRGHARHLVESLSNKLAILGPPTLVVEIPESRPDLARFFDSCGFCPSVSSADFFLDRSSLPRPGVPLIPFSVDDLLANEVWDAAVRRSWERVLQTLEARRDRVTGLAVASFEGIEAFLFGEPGASSRIVSFGCVERHRSADLLGALLGGWIEIHGPRVSIPKVTDDEIPHHLLADLGFEMMAAYREWRSRAQAS